MKTFCAVVGFLHLLFAALGMFDVLDYHLCIKGPHECRVEIREAK